MGTEALNLGANTFQFFTRNPRGSRAARHNPDDMLALQKMLREHSFAPVVAHAPYTLNPCGADERVREFALRVLKEDVDRLAGLPGCLYNLHPGCHVGQGMEKGIDLVASAMREVLDTSGHAQLPVILLETMAGKGSEVGGRFEHLKAIIDAVGMPESMGVCLDTCHVFDAGYDIVHDLDEVLSEFDAIVGLEKLRAIHLNDSLNPLGSHKDRHARIGEGYIGLAAMTAIINHSALSHLPFILETPNELPGYEREIALLRSQYVS